ncbi:MAG: RelA/SpoT domain-containing protein [Acidovorax sp.]|nr:RelA/SpoT domain-containing protein [Acidovorax sp.]
MAFPKPTYSRTQVQRAGELLVSANPTADLEKWLEAFQILSNWRACHGYPINTFQATLRNKLDKIDKKALVAQRLKRTPSILRKLERFPGMSLSRMQDIGGLRAVVGTLSQLKKLHESYKKIGFSHKLVSEYNYVENPKSSGYRSIHLVYKYKLRKESPYDGLQLELQLRTRLQHAWATAVETVGTFLEHSLKSSEGPDEWLNFFSLISSAFAYQEKTALVSGYEHLSKEQTFQKTAAEAKRLGIVDMLTGYSSALKAIPSGKAKSAYYLVELELSGENRRVNIIPFSLERLEEANAMYTLIEQQVAQGKASQVVLVSAGSIDSLKKAYPNYFLDTHEFLQQLSKISRAVAAA